MCGCAAVLGGGLPASWQPHGGPPLCPPPTPGAPALPPGASPPWGRCWAQSLAFTVGNPSGVPPPRRPTVLVPASRLARWACLQSPAPSSGLPPPVARPVVVGLIRAVPHLAPARAFLRLETCGALQGLLGTELP